ncbi:unnamed protein product [Closterium sp. NIES-64]|nr:unnamed protein product [Closterium sp. NIES-64]
MASSLPPAPESLVDNLPPVSPTAAIKAAVVRITAAATGGAVLGGALGFGLGFVAREGTKVTMRESAFGLKVQSQGLLDVQLDWQQVSQSLSLYRGHILSTFCSPSHLWEMLL